MRQRLPGQGPGGNIPAIASRRGSGVGNNPEVELRPRVQLIRVVPVRQAIEARQRSRNFHSRMTKLNFDKRPGIVHKALTPSGPHGSSVKRSCWNASLAAEIHPNIPVTRKVYSAVQASLHGGVAPFRTWAALRDCSEKKERKIFVTDFNTLGLSTSVLKALSSYSTPTPIQAQAIPQLLAGRDLLGIAQTGTGKTAAFTLPILDRLAAKGGRAEPGTCRTLILSPTRELCAQIGEAIRDYGRFCRLSVATVYGGVSISAQLRAVKPGVDIVVATPGRLVDLVERRALSLSKVGIFVLDE